MTINSATPEEWDALKTGEGFPEQRRFESGYWVKGMYFKNDKNGNKVFETPAPDIVNNPSHYNQGGFECIDYIKQQLTEEQYQGYLVGNAIKYLHRFQYKNGVEDLKKQRWYLDSLIEALE